MGHVRFSIPKELIEFIKEKVNIPVFVETGTFKGDAAAWAGDHFEKVHTIEIIEELYIEAKERWKNKGNVEFHLGDSALKLNEVIKNIPAQTMFWLDGHWSPFVVHQDAKQCPLLEELLAISAKQDSVIFIDDVTAFVGTMPPPHKANEWPTLQQIIEVIQKLFPGHRFTIMDDVIIVAPEDVMKYVDSFWAMNFNARFKVEDEVIEKDINKTLRNYYTSEIVKSLFFKSGNKAFQKYTWIDRLIFAMFRKNINRLRK
jgi:hypothetical protein